MSDGLTLREMMQRCPFQSIVGNRSADLLGEPVVYVAAPTPGKLDLREDSLDDVRELLRGGATVMVLAADHADRERILELLGVAQAHRVRTVGRA